MVISRVTIVSQLSQTVLAYICGPSVIFPSALSHSQKCPSLDNKLYSHLSDKNYEKQKKQKRSVWGEDCNFQ